MKIKNPRAARHYFRRRMNHIANNSKNTIPSITANVYKPMVTAAMIVAGKAMR